MSLFSSPAGACLCFPCLETELVQTPYLSLFPKIHQTFFQLLTFVFASHRLKFSVPEPISKAPGLNKPEGLASGMFT